MRIGIFGGSFDPVHYGHLLLAESAREQLSLDEVRLIPAAQPPHKTDQLISPGNQRLEMLHLAVGGHDALIVDSSELDRGGVSFTVDTLQQIADAQQAATLFLILGADSLHDLPQWREPERICQLAIPTAVRRAGSPPVSVLPLQPLVSPERLQEFAEHQIEMPVVELSSTDIRQRVRQGRSIRYRTPRAVEEFIATHRLYR